MTCALEAFKRVCGSSPSPVEPRLCPEIAVSTGSVILYHRFFWQIMALGLSVFLCLWVLAEAGGHTYSRVGGSFGAAALPRRFGYAGYSHVSSQSRALLNYDHPDEREGVDLRSYSNVDFRSSLAKKQAAAAAMMKDIGSEIGAADNMDTSADMVDAQASEQTVTSLTDGPGAEGDSPAEAADPDPEIPAGAMPVSYGVRIGEDGELDGGEDFGDHIDYDSTDAGEDYMEDVDDAGEDEWAGEVQIPEDSKVDTSLQGADA